MTSKIRSTSSASEDFQDEIDDQLDEILESDLMGDLEEAAEAELAALLAESGGVVSQRQSTLASKLTLFSDGKFPISPYSQYVDKEWILFKDLYGIAQKVRFDGLSPFVEALKKALIYHLIPDFAPFGGIRSYTTTKGYGQVFAIIERYILNENFLSGDAESLSVITPRLLNGALDKAKSSDSKRHYHSLFFFIRLWSSLSSQNLIPSEVRLAIDITKVDSPERRKDVALHFSGSMGTWKPFSESDLEKMAEYAFFWTEKAMPRLLSLVDYVKANHLDKANKCAIVRYTESREIEDNFNIEIDGVSLIAASKICYEYPYGTKEQYVYNWIQSYARALDKVRNGIFILVALITGMRASELTICKFEDVIKDEDGNYSIKVTRFKTSQDPNVHGDSDLLPLPMFIGQKIEEFKRLKEVYNFGKAGYIFQSNKSKKKLNKPTTHIVQNITKELSEELGIDRLHTHRFRKTIAEILINRSERNIDIIRFLFGHASYAMTLRYISRNPYLVRSVTQAIEQNYAEEFTEIVTSVRNGASSGEHAARLAKRINSRPDAFTGKQLKVTIYTYITHLLSAGEPIFIHRTAVGCYCVSDKTYSTPHLPPCLAVRKDPVLNMLPDPTRCDNSCEHAVIVKKAERALQDNVKFYSHMLETAADTLTDKAKKMIRQKIMANTAHLENLKVGNSPERLIPIVQVQI